MYRIKQQAQLCCCKPVISMSYCHQYTTFLMNWKSAWLSVSVFIHLLDIRWADRASCWYVAQHYYQTQRRCEHWLISYLKFHPWALWSLVTWPVTSCDICNVYQIWTFYAVLLLIIYLFNSWMDQNETWHGGRPRPRPQLTPKRAQSRPPPIFGPCPLWPNSWKD